MPNGSQKRGRSKRVAALELQPTALMRAVASLRRGDVLIRVWLCILAAAAIWGMTTAWAPAFAYRVGYTPERDVVARVPFMVLDARNPELSAAHKPGDHLADGGKPLELDDVRVLEQEHLAWLAQLSRSAKVYRSIGVFGAILALYALCGYYIGRREPAILDSLPRFAGLLVMVVSTICLSQWLSQDPWRAELIPPMLFGMTIAIAYSRELAILLSAAAATLIGVTSGATIGDLLIVSGAVGAAVLMLGQIRSRSKLIKVGFLAGMVACALTLVFGILDQQPVGRSLLTDAGRNALWSLATGFLITGLLPFIENLFGVLTDISLLELGDVAHPLLQELVRRAPGTYNHSINVASLAESAADAIGSNGLLARVGAYFHDIGKMLKPEYFIENQGQDPNRHDTLMPAMSTLIIIAHIKDGADLARQHHLPQRIIDFIEQHHGTTLVEYFYRRASEQHEANPDSCEVDERTFRYPGPKPQTKEAGVLMLADAVESASRVLVDPAPARIESLVHDLVDARLRDGQFGECSLDLQELRIIQESLVKSLTSMYHGRIKYPDQRTA